MLHYLIGILCVSILTISGCGKESGNENINATGKTSVRTQKTERKEKVCVLPERTVKNPESLLTLKPSERKKAFISLIVPAVLRANCIIKKERQIIIGIKEKLKKGMPLSEKEKRFLNRMKRKYRASTLDQLLIKVNTLPPSLVIAQAAIESGWGTSRFFAKGNNIFGIWTFSNKTESIKAKNGTARLRKYPSLLSSVEDYYYNINTGWAYEALRKARLKEKDSLKLAKYLRNYSILRDEYVRRLKNVIRKNNLQRFDNCTYDNCTVKL
ncbi:glucosaminidase domain-containing protein [Desulfurobacterium sp.]